MSKFALVGIMLFMPALCWAESHVQAKLGYAGFMTGMLLVSWLSAILINQHSVRRVIDLLVGITSLAFLATSETWLFLVIALILLVEQVYIFRLKKASKVALFTSLMWFVSFSSLSLITVNSALWLGLPILIVVAKYVMLSVTMSWYSLAKVERTIGQASIITTEHNLLADRSSFTSHYKNWLALSPSRVVVLIKLEGLADINRTLGHEFGDLVLTQMSTKINKILNTKHVMPIQKGAEEVHLAHLSGVDYVCAIDTDIEQHAHQKLIYQIQELVTHPINVANCNAEIAMRSAFVVDNKRADIEELIANCYVAIAQTTTHAWCNEFTPAMAQQLALKKSLLHEVQNLDIEKELQLYFHPVINMKDNSIEFVELLLRWHHPQRGTLDAIDFIDEIKHTGLTMQVAQWVVTKACELSMAMQLEGVNTPLSINLFGPELIQEEFIEYIAEQKQLHQLMDEQMILECPAQVFAQLEDHGDAILRRLKALNVLVCLDDLGATPLLLSHLPRMPLGYIKVDGNIVQELTENVNTRSLLSGIIDMSNSLNVRVICEGIESELHYTHITTMKCDAAQGYLFTRPISSTGIIGWLKQWQKRLANGERPY